MTLDRKGSVVLINVDRRKDGGGRDGVDNGGMSGQMETVANEMTHLVDQFSHSETSIRCLDWRPPQSS